MICFMGRGMTLLYDVIDICLFLCCLRQYCDLLVIFITILESAFIFVLPVLLPPPPSPLLSLSLSLADCLFVCLPPPLSLPFSLSPLSILLFLCLYIILLYVSLSFCLSLSLSFYFASLSPPLSLSTPCLSFFNLQNIGFFYTVYIN